jgi:site-specific DNA recombinase
MPRAVLYCRVSTVEQTQNLSLPTQEKACREYAAREGYDVADVFVDRGESAKTTDRPEFQRMLATCRKQRGQIHAVIVYALTRFSRNNADHHAIAALLRGQGIALRSVTEPIDDSPAGRFMEGILASMAQFDNDLRRDRTKVGMRAAVERGRWVWPAPIGYRTGIKGRGEPSRRWPTAIAPSRRCGASCAPQGSVCAAPSSSP